MTQTPMERRKEIADGIFMAGFIAVNYTTDRPTRKEQDTYTQFLHKKFMEELQAYGDEQLEMAAKLAKYLPPTLDGLKVIQPGRDEIAKAIRQLKSSPESMGKGNDD